MLKRDLVKLIEKLEHELKIQQELNKGQGKHIGRLLKERAQQDAVIARFVRDQSTAFVDASVTSLAQLECGRCGYVGPTATHDCVVEPNPLLR
jgi:hypothetical protein